jgi:uncharacterized OB-fold protein
VTEAGLTLAGFFERARAGTLTAVRCAKCGVLAIPPREFCAACGQRAWRPMTLSGEGAVASYTVIRVAAAKHAADVPYAVAVVRLTEGVSLLGRVVDIPLETLAIGLPVRFRPLVRNGETALGFGPA